MAARDWYTAVKDTVVQAIRGWLDVARPAVFRAGREHPDPSAIMSTMPDWLTEVDTVLSDLSTVQAAAWTEQSKQDVSVTSFMLAQLGLTRNLLTRIPNEVYNRIFADIVEGQQAGESPELIADRIDATLLFTGSEWWENRANVITRTETNRAWQAGILAASMFYEPATGRGWVKEWKANLDSHERPSHRRVDGQVRRLTDTFTLGNTSLMFPLDPSGPPEEVINCRCDMIIREA